MISFKNKMQSALVKGAVQLALAGIITRFLGLGNRMVLSRLIGAEGLGLFQMILPVYAMAAVMAGLGLSGAVTKMVADRFARGDITGQKQVRALALRLALISASICSVIFLGVIVMPLEFIPDRRILYAVPLMPAAFCLAAISSILRSYHQGQGSMSPTSISLVGEQLVRVALGLAAAYYLLPMGLEYALAGIVLGIIGGEIACFILLFLFYEGKKLFKPPLEQAPKTMLPEIFALSIPILLIRLSTSITQTAESLLIPARLQLAGFTSSQATTLFGSLSGMALPLLFLPTVLIFPLTTTLVPAVAGAAALRLKNRIRRLINLSLLSTLAAGIISGAVLYFFSPVLTDFLYGNTAAAKLVSLLAPVAPFAYLQFTTASILHGLGRPGIAVAVDLAGTLTSLAFIYHLTARPDWGIYGVVLGYTAAFILITLADLFFIRKLVHKL